MSKKNIRNSNNILTKNRKIYVLILAFTLALVFLIFIIELVCYFFVKELAPFNYKKETLNEFIASKPLPFKNVDDFEEIKKQALGKTNCKDNRIINNNKINFPEFEIKNTVCDGPENIENGLRVTTNHIADAHNSILMFGGSTLWGTGSADRNTIPSQLQKLLNSHKYKYNVFNFGFTTVTSFQELSLLKATKIKKGDIVVFYDGANDLWQSIIYGKPNGTILGYNEKNKLNIYINKIKFYLSTKSYFYQLIGLIKNNGHEKCELITDKILSDRIEEAFEYYKKNLLDADKYTSRNGGVFIHFLQPNLVSRMPLSNYEIMLIDKMPDEMACGLKNIKKANQVFRAKYSNLLNKINAHDLTQSLLPQNTNEEYYFDWAHITSKGNLEISNKIYDSIKNNLN